MLSSNSTLKLSDVAASTVSYNDYHDKLLSFTVRHQQVYRALPSNLKLIYSHTLAAYAPTIAVLKVYRLNYHNEEPKYHVLYFHALQKQINISVDLTSENHCPLVQTLWHLVQSIETSGKL
jgi:hypothetical protein